MKNMRKKLTRRGFTLIEIVVVIVILVTLASVATPLYLNYVKRANIGAAKTQMKLLEDALTGYRLDIGSYPDGNAGLQALVENQDNNEKWNGPYIKPAVPKDPWGNAYVYTGDAELLYIIAQNDKVASIEYRMIT